MSGNIRLESEFTKLPSAYTNAVSTNRPIEMSEQRSMGEISRSMARDSETNKSPIGRLEELIEDFSKAGGSQL